MDEGDENQNHDQEKSSVKKKIKDSDVVALRRPIIFICNDMYARALAPLREIALTVKIPEASPSRLHARLR